VIDQLANSYDIPAHMPARGSISDDFWKIILLLRIVHHNDPLALRQWLPMLGLTSYEINALRNEAIAGSLPFFDHCFSMTDARIVQFQDGLHRLRMSVDDPEAFFQHIGSFDNVRVPDDFVQIVNSVLQDDGRLPSLDRLIGIIYRRFGVLEEDEIIPDEDRVLVATMHSAKGLEAEVVYCLWLNATYMPMSNRDPDEERRVLYVALTRAKQDVILTFHEGFEPGGRGRLRREAMSPFLREISNHLRILRVTAPEIRSASFSWGLR